MEGLYAKCIKTTDPWGDKPSDLELNVLYPVSTVSMGQSYTSIYLTGHKGGYNSVMFEFYLDGKKHDIYEDPKYNPYI